jgi:hypothetical protein
MTDTEMNSEKAAERRTDGAMREVVGLVIIELREWGIMEDEIQAFLSRRRNRAIPPSKPPDERSAELSKKHPR